MKLHKPHHGRMWLAASAVLAASTLVACGTGAQPATTSSAPASLGAAPSADKLNTNATLKVRLVLEPTSLNIFTTAGTALDQILLDNVYQNLVTIDTANKNQIVPQLAKSWDISADGLTYTFKLVSGARFHDGAPLTAADAAWSLQQQFAPDSKSVRASAFTSVTQATAVDANTLKITLKQRDTSLLWNLAQRGGIVYRQGTDFTKLDGAENGSGPFKLANWNRGSGITLTRNDDYWGEKPKVAEIALSYIKEANTANNAQSTGQTDVETAADSTLLQPFSGDKFTILRGSTTDKFTLAFNERVAPLNDPRVRHAIRQAIDKDAVIKAVGAGVRIGAPVPPQDPWYEDLTSIDPHDVSAAKKLLADAGHPDGLKLTLDVPNIYPTTISDVLVSDLKQAGITLTVRQVEFQTWLTNVYTNHNYQLSLVDHAESRDLNIYTRPDYYFGYNNPQVKQWYEESQTAASDADRDALLKKVARQISSDAPADWLLLSQTFTVVRKGVYGVPANQTSSRLNLTHVAVEK
ncbi:MAG: ABC transporter substrate-binding protein [Gordonia sp. (in: high G+C Gram-positive bacteria)]